MLFTQSFLEYGALESLVESVMRLRARGYAWFDEWGDTALVIGAICVAGWVVLRVVTQRRHCSLYRILKAEASQALGIVSEQIGEDLQRHVPVELGVAGAVDLTHPPSPILAVTWYGPRVVPGATANLPKLPGSGFIH